MSNPAVQRDIPEQTLSSFAEFIAGAMGLHFPPPRWPDLFRGLSAAASDLGFDDPAACARELMRQPLTKRHLDVLADHLTVGETYFFREPRTFEVLTETIVPELIRIRQKHERRIRIWSAACCTGEEAYSIAMLLREIIPDVDDWNLTLLATDINPRFLRKAEKGVFGPWSFRDAPERMKDRYFRPAGQGQLQIAPQIKQMVRFANLNLVDDGYPSLANDTNAMDVIFCRNVLMYFTPEQATKVIEKLHRAQMDGGWLFVSASELPQVSFPHYVTEHFPGAIVYRRQDKPASVQNPPPPASTPIAPPILPARIHVAPPRVANKPKPTPAKESGQHSAMDLLARSLANQGKLAEALECCDRWVDRDKLNAQAHYLRAVILQEQGTIEEAVRSLRAATYLNPNFVLAHFALGTIARRRGQDRQASKHLDTALRLSGRYRSDELLPESDGITAGRFAQMIHSLQNAEAIA